MSLIRPFTGLRPVAGRAAEVAAPPYDVLNTEEARQRAQGRPWSFLHISKPEIDLPEGTDPYSDAVYAKGAANLQRMIDEGVLARDAQPCYYFYRLIMGEHEQTGLVAVASVADYDTNRIRKHEFTRPDKEDDRVRNIEALNAQTGPVFLTYRHSAMVDEIALQVTRAAPDVDITADDGVKHTLWAVNDAGLLEQLTATFEAMECLYIADGHHRSAAASRVCASRKANNPDHTGDESYNYFLSVIFPDNQMKILDYNRVVTDLNGLDSDSYLVKVKEAFDVETSDSPVSPGQNGEYGMYLDGQWYRLNIHSDRILANDPVGSLDVSLLADQLIEPVLGISDPRRDKRIDFVGGIRGLAELERRVNSGEMAVAFSLYPTRIEQLMAVADAGNVMPPKSTWFEPKLADGLVSHVLD
ncbi:DUF1015 domain-containing protein [Sulfuriflexus sp.]|uniref:DUF1015 domain-containing protein n=1 Tax=Sulfuriflexus sp. TaxID=2015443 RepID=UPI0028CDF3CF|nr:DUF1015 family protein [Sulfuriflexus sp.]MDT8403262.1 DUF1015 family protein [Sulfuriflexus sp.]